MGKKGFKYFGNGKDSKKKKKSKKRRELDQPEFKTVKMTLDGKEIKSTRKIILAPVDVPKEFTKVRNKCNHAGKLITPAEFREMTHAYAAYTPTLDALCNLYGEDHVHVCKGCYDVVVDYAAIKPEDVEKAILTLYAAANKAVSMKRMKDDEVKAINKMKFDLADWYDISDIVAKVDEKMKSRGGFGRPVSTTDLNAVGNAAVVY